jgi:DNA-binding FadR family transcriptional regulator
MLLQFTRQVHDWVRRLRDSTLSVPGRADAALEEHTAILDAIEAGDPELAERRAREHMLRARAVRLRMLSPAD